jgi:hypothetical protein
MRVCCTADAPQPIDEFMSLHRKRFECFLQVFTNSGDSFSLHVKDTTAVASTAPGNAPLIDFSDLN